MLSKSIQQKGKRAEKEVANRIERAGLGKARREAGSGNGKNKADIFANIPFLIEVKNQKTIKFQEWIKQAKEQARIGNSDPNKWCLVIIDPSGVQSPERMEIYATIEFDEFLGLLKRSANPRVKEPDKEMARLMERAREFCRRLEKDETDVYSYKRFKMLATEIMKKLDC
ncbi:hypothetical protein KBH77_01610 [Patescibacteria group bacterium]|nr:hypothetical protein [Patescibacteria group bacterium]